MSAHGLSSCVFVYLAGALLAVGITNCGVQDECDPAYALLCESVNHADDSIGIGAIMGLGLAYAGTQKAEVQVGLVTCSPLNHTGPYTCSQAFAWLCIWSSIHISTQQSAHQGRCQALQRAAVHCRPM